MKKIVILLSLLINLNIFAQKQKVKLIKNVMGKKVEQIYECYTGIDKEKMEKKGKSFVEGLGCPAGYSAVLISETIE